MEIIFFVLVLIMSVVIHEVSHGYIAYLLGDPTAKLKGRLTLNPISHIDPIGSIIVPAILALTNSGFLFGWARPVPYNPHNLGGGKWGPAYVAVAGPASNLIIALVFGLGLRFLTFSAEIQGFLMTIVILNIVLAVFNLIPIPPLDGSKILFSALPYRLRYIEDFLNRYQLVLVLAVLLFASPIIMWPVSFIFQIITGLAL